MVEFLEVTRKKPGRVGIGIRDFCEKGTEKGDATLF